jgi:CRP/FNR family transcriptional regulator, cyclic AMP receptor protein
MRSPYGMEVIENCTECKLRCNQFFCDLPVDVLQRFESLKYATVFPKGSLLFVEGQSSRGIFLLCNGRVKLSSSSASGKTLITHIAEPGEVLGLSAVVSGAQYEVTAETLVPSQVNFVRRGDFLKFLSEESVACMKVAEHLSNAYRFASEQVRSLGLSESTAEKLSNLILGWCEREGKATERGISFKQTLTHEEIAQLIGASRETVTRLLGDLRNRKLIVIKGSTMIVPDLAALEKISNSA